MPERNAIQRVWATVRLVHPFPATVVVATATVLVAVARGGPLDAGFLLRALLTVAASQVAVGALNDYVDRERDGVHQRSKPIPSGLVTAATALRLAMGATVVTALLAATFGPAPAMVMAAATAGGLAYDLWLKPTPFAVAGYLVGFLGLFTWIWMVGGTAHGTYWLVYPVAGPAIVAAHLANSAPDIESDGRQRHRTLGVLLGARQTVRAIFALYGVSLLPAVALVWVVGGTVARSLVGMSAVLAGTGWRVVRGREQERTARVTLFRLMAPAIGLLAAGSLVALRQVT